MKAVIARAFGGPKSFSIEEVPDLEAAPGQARVRVAVAGVSFVDVLTAAGSYQLKPPLPFIPGSEFSGVVDQLGSGVNHLQIGDRVFGANFGGVFAEQVLVPAASLTRMPKRMSFEEGAVFRVSYATSYYALVQRGRLAPGETVLVLGAGGAVGVAAIEIAKALGARVIASASSAGKRQLCLESGADAALDNAADDWRDQIKALTAGRGVDLVVDPVGGSATERAFRALAWKGRHLVIGFAAGEIPRLPTNLALLKGAELIGVDVRQFGMFECEESLANIERILALHESGKLHPRISERYPLERFAEAMNAAARNDAGGRVVLQIAAPEAARLGASF